MATNSMLPLLLCKCSAVSADYVKCGHTLSIVYISLVQRQYEVTFPCWCREAPGRGSGQEVEFLDFLRGNYVCVYVCTSWLYTVSVCIGGSLIPVWCYATGS